MSSTVGPVSARNVPQAQVQETKPEQPAVQEPSKPSEQEPAAIPENYFRDSFVPGGQQAEALVTNGTPPVPPQGTEVSISHDIQASEVRGVRVDASAKMTNTKVEPDLSNTVTIEASASIGSYVAASTAPGAAKDDPVTLEGKALAGQKFTYETKVSQEQANAIRNGTGQLPNPFDPLSMPAGSAAVFKGQNYVSTELEGAYRNIAAESKVTDLRGVGMSVEKLDDKRVKISAGPVDAVENEAYLGLKDKHLAFGVKNKKALEDSSMRVAELDVSTQEGMDKYQRFLVTGQVPEADGNGVTKSGTTQTLKLTDETSARANVGPFEVSAQLASSEGERKVTQYTDGSRSEELSLNYGQNVSLTVSKDFDFRGLPEDTGKPTYALTMGKVDPGSSSYLAAAFADDVDSAEAKSYESKPAQDAQISFTPEQALEMQRMATEYVQKYNPPGTSLESASNLGTPGFMRQVAMAKNADEVAALFAKAPSSGSVASHLLNLRLEPENVGKPLPGNLRMQTSP
jgi:hypothetical protein